VGLGLFFALLGLFASLLLFQLTSEGAAKQTLRRSVAALTEIDLLVDRNYDDLQRDAQNANAGSKVQLKGYPISIDFSPAEVESMSKEQLRSVLLDRSANLMYSDGTAPLRATAANDGRLGRFSVAGVTAHGLGFLRSRNHGILAVTTFALAAVCAVLALLLASMCRGFGRLTGVGVVIVTASIPMVVGGIGARLYMRIATGSDTEYIQREFLGIGQGLAWVPIRDGAAFTLLGLSFVVAGLACAFWADRRGGAQMTALGDR
jgi:hypothetical protein